MKSVATEFIDAFAEEEAAVSKLNIALQAQGTGAALEQYRALATQFQSTTTFSDDLIISMEALLVQVGGVLPGQMAGALTASTNLAAGLGISLESATTLVAKAFGQGGEQLGKLKALLGDSVKPGADMAEVLKAINDKFGGQAAAQIGTYSGQMAQLNNQMSDFKEKVGELLVNALTPLLNAFKQLPESGQTLIIGIVAIGTALAPLALSAAAMTTIVTTLATAFGVTMAGALTTLGGLLLPAGILIAGIAAVYVAFKKWDAISGIAQAVYNGVKTWLVDRFQSIVQAVKGYVDYIIGLWRSMTSIVGGAVSGVASGVAGMVPSFAAGGEGYFGSGTLAMLHGHEKIVPLDGGGGSGAGSVINFYINGTGQDVARVVVYELTKMMKVGRKWPSA